jgi:hypothetical protein
VVPAAVAGWYLALIVGLLVHSGIESLCPPDQMVSGRCAAPWFPYASNAVSAFGAGLAAVLVIAFAVVAAPGHRVIVARASFVTGLVVATYMLWQTSAIAEFIAAAVCGLLTVVVLQRYLRNSKSPDAALESGRARAGG